MRASLKGDMWIAICIAYPNRSIMRGTSNLIPFCMSMSKKYISIAVAFMVAAGAIACADEAFAQEPATTESKPTESAPPPPPVGGEFHPP